MPINGSVLFQSTGDALTASVPSLMILGTANFTVEAWVYLNDYNVVNTILSRNDTANTGGTAGSWYFGMNNSTGQMQWGQSTTDYWAATGPIVTLNQWNHIVYQRSGTTITGWLNGTLSITQTLSIDLNATGNINIGRGRGSSANGFSGYISNLRVTTGTALYTTTFTPSTAYLSPISGTQLLIARYFEPNSTIPDYSTNSITFTKSNTSLGSNIRSPSTANPSSADSLSLSQGIFTNLYSFMSPSASKTLYLSNSDALLDNSLIRPEDSYAIDNN